MTPPENAAVEARFRANTIVWESLLACTMVIVGTQFVHGRWGDSLVGGAVLVLALIQHHAIKIARLLGHGRGQ